MTDNSKRLKEITEKITGIPTLPTVVTKITKLMQNPRTSADEVGRAITTDASLSSKVLKLVNSAFYGFPGKINTITHAIVILGFNTVKNIVLTASIFETLGGGGDDESEFDIEKFWLHSVAVGVIAKSIATKIGFQNTEEAFIGGLLHDIGKIILYRFLPEDFSRVLKHKEENNCLIIDSEQAILGLTHSDIGGWLTAKWNLPEELSESVEFHHNPNLSRKHYQMTSCVHLADVFARALMVGSGGDKKIPLVDAAVWEKSHFSMQYLESLYKDLDAELDKAIIFMQLV